MRRAPWELTFNPQSLLTEKQHPELDGVIIELLEPSELAALPDGSEVISIFGEKKVTGQDEIDMDTRAGFTAWGVRREDQTNRDLGVFEI